MPENPIPKVFPKLDGLDGENQSPENPKEEVVKVVSKNSSTIIFSDELEGINQLQKNPEVQKELDGENQLPVNPNKTNISSELAGENQSQKTPSLVKIPIGNSSNPNLNENASTNYTRPGIYKKGACTPRTELLTVIEEEIVMEETKVQNPTQVQKLDRANQFQTNPETSTYKTSTYNSNRLAGENQSQKTPEVVKIPNGNSSPSETDNRNILMERKRKREKETPTTNPKPYTLKEEPKTKYIGESNRSGYERGKEHMSDFKNLDESSHLLKHYLQCHKNIKLEEMEVGMRVRSTFKSAIERQISEAVAISIEERKGTILMNSKAEYNRCKLPRLNTQSLEEQLEEAEAEKKKKRELENEIKDMKKKKKSRKKDELIEVCSEILRDSEPAWKRRRKEEIRKREAEEKSEAKEEEKRKRKLKAEGKKKEFEAKNNRKKKVPKETYGEAWQKMKKRMWRERRERESESDYETEEEIDIQEEADLILETLEELEKERDLEVNYIQNEVNVNKKEKSKEKEEE